MNKNYLDKYRLSIYNCIYSNSLEAFEGEIRWNPLKSMWLKRTRGISFEEIVHAKFIDISGHSSRDNQLILICEYRGYVWAVPFVFDRLGIFLKTLYQSRKFKKIYLKKE